MSIFSSWPHTWFGAWKHAESDWGEVPLFEDVVDEDWRPDDLEAILTYLNDAPFATASSSPPRVCRFCEFVIRNPSIHRTDGVWGWPADLGHYVEKHHVRLPDRLVDRIRSRNYLPGSG